MSVPGTIRRSILSVVRLFYLPSFATGGASVAARSIGQEGSWRQAVLSATPSPTSSSNWAQLPWLTESERRAWSIWLRPHRPLPLEDRVNEKFADEVIRGLVPLRIALQRRDIGRWGTEAFLFQHGVAVVCTREFLTPRPSSLEQQIDLLTDERQAIDHEMLLTDVFDRIRAIGHSPGTGVVVSKSPAFSLYSVLEGEPFPSNTAPAELRDLFHSLSGSSGRPDYEFGSYLVGGPDGFRNQSPSRSGREDLYHFQTRSGLVMVDRSSAMSRPAIAFYSTAHQHRFQTMRIVAASAAIELLRSAAETESSVVRARRRNAGDLLARQTTGTASAAYGRHVERLVVHRGAAPSKHGRDGGRSTGQYDLRLLVDVRSSADE